MSLNDLVRVPGYRGPPPTERLELPVREPVRQGEAGQQLASCWFALFRFNIMIIVEFDELGQHGRCVVACGMAKALFAADHLEGDPGVPAGDPHVNVMGVFALVGPFAAQDTKVVVASEQGVGTHEQCGAGANGCPGGRACPRYDRLRRFGTAGGTSPAASDHLGRGVIHDRARLAANWLASTTLIPASAKSRTYGAGREGNEFPLDRRDLFFLGNPVIVQGAHQLVIQRGSLRQGLAAAGPKPGCGRES